MRVKSLGAVAALIACLAVVVAVPASGDDSTGATSLYVVQLVQAPVATYGGGVAGYAATKPGKGKKIDAGSSAAQSYAGYLNAKHYGALEKVGGGDKVYDYTAVFNGFAAQLTAEQASKLELLKDVAVVEKAENVSVDATATTGSSDAFLHLSDNGGLWDKLGGVSKGGLRAVPARTSSSATSTAATGPRTPRSPTARSTARTATTTRTR